jgi:rhomboid protease GluP
MARSLTSPSSSGSSSPPRPIYTSPDDGRIVPPGWLDEAPVTRMLLALNVCVFIAEVAVNGSLTRFLTPPMLEMGASYSLATIGEGRYETLITACFMHGGPVHLGLNMYALWQAGPLVERGVGSARMAPMYLFAGAFGNLLSVLYGWFGGSGQMTVGASGAISGVVAAALVVGWRTGGWRSPLTQRMAMWLGLLVVFGLLTNLGGGNIDNAAHVGGALAGAAIAALWRRGARYSGAATAGVLAACAAVLIGCVAIVAIRDRRDPFASKDKQARVEWTSDAVSEGRCGDAHEGLAAVERLVPARREPAIEPLREEVEESCGRPPRPAP